MNNQSILFIYHIPKTAGQSLRRALSTSLGLNLGYIHLGPYGDTANREAQIPALEQRSIEELAKVRAISGHYLCTYYDQYFSNRQIQRVIFLREPAERIISQYNHAMHIQNNILNQPIVDFHEWYEQDARTTFPWENIRNQPLDKSARLAAISSVGHNYMAKFILNAMGEDNYQNLNDDHLFKKANNILKSFWHVGITEKLELSRQVIAKELKIDIQIGNFNRTDIEISKFLDLNLPLRKYLAEKNTVDYKLFTIWKKQDSYVCP